MISVSKGDRNSQRDTPTSRPTAALLLRAFGGRAVNFSFSKKPPAAAYPAAELTAHPPHTGLVSGHMATDQISLIWA